MPKNLLTAALRAHFGMSADLEVTDAAGGFLTENRFILDRTSGIKYFLKQHRPEVAKIIEYIENAEHFFAEGGIPVIMPIQTKEGKSHFLIDDKLFTLYPCVEGVQHNVHHLTPELLRTLALNLADMHLLSKDGIPKELNREVKEYWSAEKFFEKAEKVRKAIRDKEAKGAIEDFDRLILELLALKESIIKSGSVPYDSLGLRNDTVTHGDYHERNVFFDIEGNIKYIFDFEKSVVAPRAVEFVRSLLYICYSEGFLEKDFTQADVYMKAYQGRYPIDKKLIRAALTAHYMKLVHSTWVEGEHYIHNNTRTDVFLPGYLITIKYLKEHFEDFCKRLAI